MNPLELSPSFKESLSKIRQVSDLSDGLALILVVGPPTHIPEGFAEIEKVLRGREILRHRFDIEGADLSATLGSSKTRRPGVLAHGLELLEIKRRRDLERRLNMLRDTLHLSPGLILLWIPDQELDIFRQRCPDLFHWRSLVVRVTTKDLLLSSNQVAQRSSLLREIRHIQERMAKLEKVRALLGEEPYSTLHSEIEFQQLRLAARLESTMAIQRSVAEGQPSIVLRGDIQGCTLVSGDGNQVNTITDKPLLEAYRKALAQEFSQISEGVFHPAVAGWAAPLSVDEIYLEPFLEPIQADFDFVIEHRRNSTEQAPSSTPASIALAQDSARLAMLLGDAGSGKTTLARYMCYALAIGKPLPSSFVGLFPIFINLRDIKIDNRYTARPSEPADILWETIATNAIRLLGPENVSLFLKQVQRVCSESGGFLVLDGLDETSIEDREILLNAINHLSKNLGPESRVLLTTRPYAHPNQEWHLKDFTTFRLMPFSLEQTGHFLARWYSAIGWENSSTTLRAERLYSTIRAWDPLRNLAANPLLLTTMAIIHAYSGTLPEDRVGLYQASVELLLGRWDTERNVHDLNLVQIDQTSIYQALEELAWNMQKCQLTNISQEELLTTFARHLSNVDSLALLTHLQHRSELLVERSSEVFSFPHRWLQEYLTACHLLHFPDAGLRLRALALEDPQRWHEVILLSVSKARQAGLGIALGLLIDLQPDDPTSDGVQTETTWRIAVLCGQALLDLQFQIDEAQPRRWIVLKRTKAWLVQILREGCLSNKERLEAGDVLGRLGDPRPGTGSVLQNEIPQPEIAWLEVPAGPFVMGNANDDPQECADERPQHKITLQRFWISRYPITNSQFRPFVDEGGYSSRQYWSEEGWAWRSAESREHPASWTHEHLAGPTRPVVGVTYFEAQAYARWLDSVRQDPGVSRYARTKVDSEDHQIRLPTEAEWEKAARGIDRRTWPWGSEFIPRGCNFSLTGLEQPSPVGMFPGNTSPFGAMDMAGNVWEWTAQPKAGDGACSLRGGSWRSDARATRCTAHIELAPLEANNTLGFRLALALRSPTG